MKYLFTSPKIYTELFNSNPQPSGSYQWYKVLDGSIKQFRDVEDFEKYDVVHMNVTILDMPYIRQLREKLKNSSTKIVLNQDHAPELWSHAYTHPLEFAKIFELADHAFATTETAKSLIQALTRNKITCMPHPCETHILKKLRVTTKVDHAAIMYHKYDNPVFHPYFIFNDIGIKSSIIGYDQSQDHRANTTEVLYDNVYPVMQFPEYIRLLGESRLLYEPTTVHSYGRAPCESACLRIPTVGSHSISSMNKLWPKTSGNVFDADLMRKHISAILASDEYANELTDYAFEEVEYYGFKQSKERYKEMLDDKP